MKEQGNFQKPLFNSDGLMKTHHCGDITADQLGKEVLLCGWLNKYRDLGGLHFIDLRDKYGVVQLGFEKYQGDLSILKTFALESVIQCRGIVRSRPDAAKNSQMKTGEVEVEVLEIKLLAYADNVPFLPHGKVEATEDLRLKYRYIDLRSQKLQEILNLRSTLAKKIRNLLYSKQFTEVETPILYKTTPEGARDYVVPSRVHKGKVYALPQSPQTLKQLLMIANTDRYFQICKCFRDEDLRADRQPEFSQIDIEVSFSSVQYMKSLATDIVKLAFNLDEKFSIKEMSFQEAMERYGSDKPDTRFDLEHMNVTKFFGASGFSVFDQCATAGGLVKAMFISEKDGSLARKQIDDLTEVVKPYKGKGVAWFKNDNGAVSGGISKFITPELLSKLNSLLKGEAKGTWLFFADVIADIAHSCADAVRRHLGKELKLIKPGQHFLWVYDFPLFEYDHDLKRLFARHHPFTSPHLDDMDKFFSNDPQQLIDCRAQAYDLVCNGYEVAGGSIRIFNQSVQAEMFKLLGFTEEETQRQFGFFVEALKYGTPPHGGMAFGFDRLVMLVAGTDNIRDVIAFPKTASATDLMAQAPSTPNKEQLVELGMNFTIKE